MAARSRAAALWRAVAVALPVVVLLVFATGGKFYYAAGVVPVLIAAGAPVVERWLALGHGRSRLMSFSAAAVVSGAILATVNLPILPPATLAATPIPTLNDASAEQIGWPGFVATVERVVETMPGPERSHAVIFTSNYGEAGALDVLGTGLPPVYSGHNGCWDWAPPATDRTTAVLVGIEPFWRTAGYFQRCRVAATIDDAVGVDNQEQGHPILVCTQPKLSWTEIWPSLRHLD